MLNTSILFYTLLVCALGFALVYIVYYFWKTHNRSHLDYHASVKLAYQGEEERRKQPRVNISWPVSMKASDGMIDAEAKNISLGGAFICCSKPLPLGQIFSLTLIGPNNEPLVATAKVAWSNINVPNEKVVNRGMGVRFIKMSDRHIQVVRQLYQENI